MRDFIYKNLRFDPILTTKGKVYISFTVQPNGSISNIEIKRGLSSENDEEVLRIIAMMPNSTLGSIRGNPRKQNAILPIDFK